MTIRMFRTCSLFAGGLWLGFVAPALTRSAAGVEAPPRLKQHVEELVAKLSDPDGAVRDAADAQLCSFPAAAAKLVEDAAASPDLDVEQDRRLKHALQCLRPRAVLEEAKAQRREWETRMLLGAYDGGGHVGAADAAASRDALAAFARVRGQSADARIERRPELMQKSQAAVDAGATDPLVLTLAAMLDEVMDFNGRWRAPDGSAIVSLKAVCAGPYPPIAKFFVVIELLRIESNVIAEWPHASEYFQAAARDPALPSGELDRLASQYFDIAATTHPDYQILPKFLKTYSGLAPGSAHAVFLRGMYEAHLADEKAAGKGILTAQESTFIQERLRQADALCEQAWGIDPTDAVIAVHGLRIKTQEQDSDADAVDLWFGRAIRANPDAVEAYRLRLDYLSRRNDASGAYLAFARECLRTQNYYSGIPAMIITAHQTLAEDSGDSAVYFTRQEVWADVSLYFETALLNFPDDMKLHCQYALLASKCGKWSVVRRQCDVIGDSPTNPPFKSAQSYAYLRRKAVRLSAENPK